jgi:hypothetical protein
MPNDTGIAQIQKYIGDVEYPATKRRLIWLGQDEGASPQIIQLLEQLPDQVYQDPIEVNDKLNKIQ